ncbi:MAG: hypothetical protein V9H69_12630 [Anaerolineae bacterium]
MIAVRSVQEVIAGAVTIKLPAHFASKRVKVIVLPIEEDEQESGQLMRLLLAAPTLSDNDLRSYDQVKEWISQWTVNDF